MSDGYVGHDYKLDYLMWDDTVFHLKYFIVL